MRRQAALVVVLVLVGTGCWAQFRGDATHSGAQPYESVVGRANVATLTPTWSADLVGLNPTDPTIAAGAAFVGSDRKLYAFDAAGAKNCSLSQCAPLWTGTVGNDITSTAAAANGFVYAASLDRKLYAFSIDGTTNCSGTPKVCTPVWTAAVGSPIGAPLAVANGVIFVTSGTGRVFGYDAAGVTNCTGTPLVCKPVWSTASGPVLVKAATIANGVVYSMSSTETLYAYDAAGAVGCTGTTTRTCKPQWSATVGGAVTESPAVADGRVYVPGGQQGLQAFDAAGVVNCSGAPKTCTPMWTSAGGSFLAPAVTNSVVYGDVGGTLAAFDAHGVTNCSASPVICSPLWTAPPGTLITESPSVANGVVYANSGPGNLEAFDATGTSNCSGTPSVCTPLWGARDYTLRSPVIANGSIYSVGGEQLRAYRTCSNPVAGVGYAPCELTNAYRLPSLVGGIGKTVAIVDANHDPNAFQDLAVYRKTFGLPPCAGGCFRQVNQLGQTSNYPPADPGWAVEISLDLDMVSAACPYCKILLVEAPNTLEGIDAAEDTAVALGADVVSNSFGTNETFNISLNDSHFTHPGVPIVAASGDGGYAAGPQYPAVIPGVTAVGGTFLDRAATPRGWTESVWADGVNIDESGSGCAHYQAKPAWQTDTGCTQRTVADVSAVAHGLAVYDTYGGPTGWITVGGTSASAPLVAGIYALAHGTTGVSESYANTSFLHDVINGSNGTCNSSYLCTAGIGYDGPTGLGTPCGTRAFGPAFASPTNCNTPPAGATLLEPSARLARPTAMTPACRTAPPGGVRCLAYVQR